MPLALFDLDNTLLKGDSEYAWGLFMAEKKLADPEPHVERCNFYQQQYESGALDIEEFIAFHLSPIIGKPQNELEALQEEFLDAKVTPMITDESQALLDRHRTTHTLVIITATNDMITRPIAHMFGVEHLIATQLEVTGNGYTGRIVGDPCFQGGKILRVQQWMQEHGESLNDSWFYSDSHNDLPLMNQVEHPVAVNPDPVLETEAIQKRWKIIRF